MTTQFYGSIRHIQNLKAGRNLEICDYANQHLNYSLNEIGKAFGVSGTMVAKVLKRWNNDDGLKSLKEQEVLGK